MLKHYVEILYRGMLFDETDKRKVKSRDASKVKVPKEAYGFRFFDLEEIVKGNETLVGEPKNYSGIFYFGKVMTLEDVEREMPKEDSLLWNMKNNGYKKVIKTRSGNFKPFFEKKDKVLGER